MAIHAIEPLVSPVLVARSVGLGLRLRVRFARAQLDVELAAGAESRDDRAAALRSEQLTSLRGRRAVADGVERACRRPQGRAGFSAAMPVHSQAIAVARPTLLELAAALRRDESVRAQGVALARLLLTQAEGPLYRPEHLTALQEAACLALLALRSNRRPAPPCLEV